MVLRKSSIVAAILWSGSFANASTVLVNQPEPYPQYVMGDANGPLYYAGNLTGSPTLSNSIASGKGYRFLETDSVGSAGLIYIDVSTSKALTVGTGQTIGVSVFAVGGSEVTLTGAEEVSGTAAPASCVVNTTCVGDLKGAYYRAGTTLRLSFTVANLCAAGVSSTLCSGGAPIETAGHLYAQGIQVNFAVVNSGIPNGSTITTGATTNGDQSSSVFLYVTDINPTTGCPSGLAENYYFPGDGQIYFYTGNYSSGTNGGAPVQHFLVMALENSSPANDFESGVANSLAQYVPADGGMAEIKGFTNTTDGNNHKYAVVAQSVNRAGLVSASGSACHFSDVQSQDISGVLKESKCFIATAAFHDGRAAPVMVLRQFRDRILSKFSTGRNFIEQYYRYSPALAEWAWDKPIIRSFALKILAPFELMAWAVLKLSSAQESSPDQPQPYIDRLKKTLPPQETSEESYTEREKKKLLQGEQRAATAEQSYIEKIRNGSKAKESEEVSAKGYTEKEKAKLPPEKERESPIAEVKAGRDHRLGLGDLPEIKSAAGLKLGVTPGMEVTVAGGSHSFSDVYGSGFQPELIFHYERQLFHSENYGSFGLGIDAGLAYSGGKGLLQFGFGSSGSKVSQTAFGFYQVPTIAAAIYRFNLLRILRPYISGGAGAISYVETRSDSKSDKRGISAVYSGSAGMALLLDFLDAGTKREAYLSEGIQHTYLFIEYLYLNTFKSAVSFRRSGVYSGFTFEF